MNYTKSTLQKMELLFEEMKFTIRYEKGNFQSGFCIVENKNIAVVNKFFDTEGRINTLIEIFKYIEKQLDKSGLSENTQKFLRVLNKEISQNASESLEEEKVDAL